MVILITGKAGAGKTHYMHALAKELTDAGKGVATFDGDALRGETGNKDFTDKGRIRNLIRAASLARQHEYAGDIVLCAFVAPKKEWRDMMRRFWDASRVVYIPGGTLWKGTEYETPTEEEFAVKINSIMEEDKWQEQPQQK